MVAARHDERGRVSPRQGCSQRARLVAEPFDDDHADAWGAGREPGRERRALWCLETFPAYGEERPLGARSRTELLEACHDARASLPVAAEHGTYLPGVLQIEETTSRYGVPDSTVSCARRKPAKAA